MDLNRITSYSIAQKIDEYISFIDLKPISKVSYEKVLAAYLEYLRECGIKNPNRNTILAYKEYLIKRKLASATIQKTLVVLRGFYRYLKLNGIDEDITYAVKGVKVATTYKRQPLTEEDIRRVIVNARKKANTQKGKRNLAIIVLLFTTGVRSVEIERADIEDIDVVGNGYVLYIQGKGRDDKDNFVKLTFDVYKILLEYLEGRNNLHQKRNPLFTTHLRSGKEIRMKTAVIRSMIKEHFRSIGLDSRAFSAHSTRHSFATLSLIAGASILEVKESLRHSSITSTQIYSHLVEKMKSGTNELVSDVILGNKKGDKHEAGHPKD
ncbi:MAG: site-specific integrase [Erysipelotrichales bacterium]|nr:site-specific integrase [Erysipelotrichales bacterium]